MVGMQDKKAIVFVGMPGSGKSVCVKYLTSKGLPLAYLGGITLDEIKRRGLEDNETNEKLVREELRAQEGAGVYANRIVSQIEKYFSAGNDYVVVDGLYSWTEYKIFKEKFGDNAIIIAVVAPRGLRHQRFTTREVRPLTVAEANERDYAEIENIEKGGTIANADYFFCNDSNIDVIKSSLESLLKELGVL